MKTAEDVIRWLERDSQRCDCFAYEDDECACGARGGYKSVYYHNLLSQLYEAFPEVSGTYPWIVD